MKYDPEVWGKHYWFVLHTIAVSYPERPNEVTKKKYYRLIQDFPLFLPDAKASASFADLIEQYPVTPYLDHRMSFMKWTHFIHNKVNESIGKAPISFYDAMELYYANYKPRELREKGEKLNRERMVWLSIVLGLITFGVYSRMS